MPEIRIALGRQLRGHNFCDEFRPQHEQAANMDETPVYNLGMERLCGFIGYRAKKLCQLEKVSRSIIVDATSKLREISRESIRSLREQAIEIKKLKMESSEKMKDCFEMKIDEKEVVLICLRGA